MREAWPSPATRTDLTAGLLRGEQQQAVVVESDALVIFGDGLEADRLTATWGQTISVGLSGRVLNLVD